MWDCLCWWGEIFSLPILKVVNDGLIIGIITETNQFVMLKDPEENIYDVSKI